MALHGDVSVNGRRILSWDAQRLVIEGTPQADIDHPHPDAVHTYLCSVGALDSKPAVQGQVEHRYGDGAAALAAKVLALAPPG